MNKKMRNALNTISKAVANLSVTKVKLYTKVWELEKMYTGEREKSPEFLNKNPRFNKFVKSEIPLLDYYDYLKYKGFVANNLPTHTLMRISDEALSHIRSRVVVREKVHPDFKKFFNKLPKKGTITWEIAYKVFADIRPAKKGTSLSDEIKKASTYNKKQLARYKKDELVNLVMYLQRKLIISEATVNTSTKRKKARTSTKTTRAYA